MATILVVDDEPDVVEIVRFRLEGDGHHIVCAGDGPGGLAAVIEHQPDLVLLDLMMPGYDGFELLRRMKEDDRLARVPVILLTAKAELASVIQGWNWEVDNYITKPFDLDELTDIVESVLNYKSSVLIS